MALTMAMWKLVDGNLAEIPKARLSQESELEKWILNDPTILGLESLVIGHQIKTDHGGILDVLAMDRAGNLTIIELKRDKTPRDVVAQVLDYAAWVRTLGGVDPISWTC
jgi:RecB family endonuclease NucS